MARCGFADFTGEFSRIGAEPNDLEAQFRSRDIRDGRSMAGVAEDEGTLAGEIGRVDRAGIPGQARGGFAKQRRGVDAGELRDFRDEGARSANADRHAAGRRLTESALQPRGGLPGDFWIENDVEIGIAEARNICRRRTKRRDDIHCDAELVEQPGDFSEIVAVPEAQCRRAEDVARCTLAFGPLGTGRPRGRGMRACKRAHDAVEGFGRTPVFLALIGRQLQRDHGDRKVQRGSEPTGIVLDQFGRAG